MIAALAFPTLQSLQGGYKARAASDTVRAAWANARVRAMEDGRPYRFAVVRGRGNYRIAPDEDAFWSGNDMPDNEEDDGMVLEGSLPDPIHFSLDENDQPVDGPPLEAADVNPGD